MYTPTKLSTRPLSVWVECMVYMTGRQYDRNGNLVQWWSDEASHNFKQKAQCIIEQYRNYTVDVVKMNVSTSCITATQPRLNSLPGGEWKEDSGGEYIKIFNTILTIIATEIFLRKISEKTRPEWVHASGAGRHAIKTSGLCRIWPIITNKQIATGVDGGRFELWWMRRQEKVENQCTLYCIILLTSIYPMDWCLDYNEDQDHWLIYVCCMML